MSVSLKRQVNFVTGLHEWLGSGSGIEKSMLGFEMALKEHGSRRELLWLERIKRTVQRGQPIAKGMEADFSPQLVMMMRLGQKYGCLGPILSAFNAQNQRERAALVLWMKKMSYPLLLCLVSCIALIFIGTQVLPRFADQGIFDDAHQMTVTAQIVHRLAEFLLIGLPLIVGVGILIAMGLRWLLPTVAAPWRRHLESLYIFRVYRRTQLISFLRTSSILLHHNVSFAAILQELKALSTPYLRHYLTIFLARVRRGEFEVAQLLRSPLVDKTILFRLQCQNPKLPLNERLDTLAVYVEGDLDRLLVRAQHLIAGACFFLAGCFMILLFLALATMMRLLAQGAM